MKIFIIEYIKLFKPCPEPGESFWNFYTIFLRSILILYQKCCVPLGLFCKIIEWKFCMHLRVLCIMCLHYVTLLFYKSIWNVKITYYLTTMYSIWIGEKVFWNSCRSLRRTSCSGYGFISICRKSRTASISETVLPCNFTLFIFVPFAEV
jgi:hypothetical protein